jgi:NitT/TauT family transport system substrate-binding protein
VQTRRVPGVTADFPTPSRRQFLQLSGYGAAGVALASLLSACGGSDDQVSADGTTTLTTQLAWILDSEFAPLILADDSGYYRDQQLDVELLPGGTEIGAIEGIVAGGSADIGISIDITSVIAAIADGNPLVCIGTLYQSNLNVLMSPSSAPITSVDDLVGKRIGGVQGYQTKFDAIFTLAGRTPDYTFVPVGYGPDALINGDCDVLSAFLTDEVIAYRTATADEPSILTYDDLGLPAYTMPIYVTRETLESKRDTLKGFLRATLRGFADDVADPGAAAETVVRLHGDPAELTAEGERVKNAAYVPLASSDTTTAHGLMYIDVDYLSGPIYAGMEAAGLRTADVGTAVDMSLLDEINGE